MSNQFDKQYTFRICREIAALSQPQLTKAIHSRYGHVPSVSTISRHENISLDMKRKVSSEILLAYSRVYGMPMSYFYSTNIGIHANS